MQPLKRSGKVEGFPSKRHKSANTCLPKSLWMQRLVLAEAPIYQKRFNRVLSHSSGDIKRKQPLSHSLQDTLTLDSKFKDFNLFCRLDLNEPFVGADTLLRRKALSNRRGAVEIFEAEDLIFYLMQNGVGVVFCRKSLKRLMFINLSHEEHIRSLYYNRMNRSLVAVSVYKADKFTTLSCRSILISAIKRRQKFNYMKIFDEERLTWPGFVEFDDCNGLAITFDSESRAYKVWNLQNYELLYSMKNEDIDELKVSPGILLVVGKHKRRIKPEILKIPLETTSTRNPERVRKTKRCFFNDKQKKSLGNRKKIDEEPSEEDLEDVMPVQLLDIKTGSCLKKWDQVLGKKDEKDFRPKIEFVEQFDYKLLLKQVGFPLKIINVLDDSVIEVSSTKFVTPAAFVFLHDWHLFLTFNDGKTIIWDFQGRKVSKLDDHELRRIEGTKTWDSSNICIPRRQNLMISATSHCGRPTVSVSDIYSGRLLGRIGGRLSKNQSEGMDMCERRKREDERDKVLEVITGIAFSESRNEIYTCDEAGSIVIWRQ